MYLKPHAIDYNDFPTYSSLCLALHKEYPNLDLKPHNPNSKGCYFSTKSLSSFNTVLSITSLGGKPITFTSFTFTSSAPRYAITGVPYDIPASSLIGLFGITEAKRLLRAGQETTCVVVSAPQSPPETFKLAYTFFCRTSIFIPEPVQCYRCWRWGHNVNTCGAPSLRCYKCGKAHKSDSCKAPTGRCINCSGPHATSYKGCPSRKECVYRALGPREWNPSSQNKNPAPLQTFLITTSGSCS